MIITTLNKTNEVALRWREDGERKEEKISFVDFKPYFYIEDTEREKAYIRIRERGVNIRLELFYERGDWVSLEGKRLKKVTWTPPLPAYTRIIRKEWEKTYEADVPFHYRYVVDNLESIPEYDLKKWYWDMEWQQGGDFDGMITALVIYDNIDKKMHNFHWFPPTAVGDYSDTHWRFESEKEMLVSFLTFISHKDPDMMISWFGSKFDLPKLIERLLANGLDPRNISPYNEVKGVYFDNQEGQLKLSKAVSHYTPIEQPIRGRIVLNLDVAFERQWNDSQRGTLPSMTLDYVAELVLGEKKMVSEKFPDKNEFFAKAWLEESQTYMDYAKKDVELLVKIDEKNYLSESILALQRLLIAPFDACFYASNMGSIYFMRNADWKAPTGKEGPKVDYQGAMIYDPSVEGTFGLHENVAAFDFAGLYPSITIALNISWETKSETETEFGINILTPRDFSEENEVNMLYYKTDKLGMLPKAVLELKQLRNEYKKNMKEAKTDDEYYKWYNNQMAVKRLMASFYGIIGYQGFSWADIDMAASITAGARKAIRSAAFKVMEL
tara:strand:- start:361 stop:2022 length:1662 start_codon:yes stop_codon:yes gene_type:complete